MELKFRIKPKHKNIQSNKIKEKSYKCAEQHLLKIQQPAQQTAVNDDAQSATDLVQRN